MAWQIESKPIASTAPKLPAGIPLVCICVPHFGSVSLEWVNTTYGPLYFIPRSDYAKTFRLAKGLLNLDTERNDLVKQVLEDKAVTHILFLDSDVIMESPADVNQAVANLLQINVPVVSGLYRAKKLKGNYPYAMWAKNPGAEYGYVDIPKWTGNFINADAIGFGFVLLKREVFEKIPYPWFVWDKVSPSEDFDFCEKLIKHGYEIKVFTEVKLSHGMTGKVRIDGAVHVLDV